MLRPATPLTLLLFIAFVLLLLSVLSTPIVHKIPLASFKGRDFGVFGYCTRGATCSGIQVGYSMFAPLVRSRMASSSPVGESGSARILCLILPLFASDWATARINAAIRWCGGHADPTMMQMPTRDLTAMKTRTSHFPRVHDLLCRRF